MNRTFFLLGALSLALAGLQRRQTEPCDRAVRRAWRRQRAGASCKRGRRGRAHLRRRRNVGRAHGAGHDRRVRRLSMSVLRSSGGYALEGAGGRTARRSSASCSRSYRSRFTRTRGRQPRPPKGCARSGGDAAFWRFYASAFAGQKELGPESYVKWAEAAGRGRARRSRRGIPRGRPRSTATSKLAKKIGIDGTPTFLVNGELVDGRAAVRSVRASRERGAREGQGARRVADVAADKVYATLDRVEHKEEAEAAQKRQAEEDKPDTNVYKVALGKSPDARRQGRGGHDRGVLGLPVPVLQGASRRRSSRSATKYGEGRPARLEERRRSPSTRAPSRPRSWRWRRGRRRATRGSGRRTTRCSRRRASSGTTDLVAIARDLKLDVREGEAARSRSTSTTKSIDDDGAPGGRLRARRGRRTSSSTGAALVGAQPVEAFAAIIDDELAKAQRARGEGAPRRRDVRRADEGRRRAGRSRRRRTTPVPADAPVARPREGEGRRAGVRGLPVPVLRAGGAGDRGSC